MGVTLTTLTTRVRQLIQEAATGEMTDAIVQQQIQAAARDVYRERGLLKSSENITIVAGTALYTLTEAGYWYDILSVEYAEKELSEITETQAREYYGDKWRTLTGTPSYYIRHDDDTLRFVPYPNAVPTTSPHAKVWEWLYPAALNDTTNTLIERYELAVCYRAAEKLLALDKADPEGMQRAAYWNAKYREQMGQNERLTPEAEGHIPLTGADWW